MFDSKVHKNVFIAGVGIKSYRSIDFGGKGDCAYLAFAGAIIFLLKKEQIDALTSNEQNKTPLFDKLYPYFTGSQEDLKQNIINFSFETDKNYKFTTEDTKFLENLNTALRKILFEKRKEELKGLLTNINSEFLNKNESRLILNAASGYCAIKDNKDENKTDFNEMENFNDLAKKDDFNFEKIKNLFLNRLNEVKTLNENIQTTMELNKLTTNDKSITENLNTLNEKIKQFHIDFSTLNEKVDSIKTVSLIQEHIKKIKEKIYSEDWNKSCEEYKFLNNFRCQNIGLSEDLGKILEQIDKIDGIYNDFETSNICKEYFIRELCLNDHWDAINENSIMFEYLNKKQKQGEEGWQHDITELGTFFGVSPKFFRKEKKSDRLSGEQSDEIKDVHLRNEDNKHWVAFFDDNIEEVKGILNTPTNKLIEEKTRDQRNKQKENSDVDGESEESEESGESEDLENISAKELIEEARRRKIKIQEFYNILCTVNEFLNKFLDENSRTHLPEIGNRTACIKTLYDKTTSLKKSNSKEVKNNKNSFCGFYNLLSNYTDKDLSSLLKGLDELGKETIEQKSECISSEGVKNNDRPNDEKIKNISINNKDANGKIKNEDNIKNSRETNIDSNKTQDNKPRKGQLNLKSFVEEIKNHVEQNKTESHQEFFIIGKRENPNKDGELLFLCKNKNYIKIIAKTLGSICSREIKYKKEGEFYKISFLDEMLKKAGEHISVKENYKENNLNMKEVLYEIGNACIYNSENIIDVKKHIKVYLDEPFTYSTTENQLGLHGNFDQNFLNIGKNNFYQNNPVPSKKIFPSFEYQKSLNLETLLEKIKERIDKKNHPISPKEFFIVGEQANAKAPKKLLFICKDEAYAKALSEAIKKLSQYECDLKVKNDNGFFVVTVSEKILNSIGQKLYDHKSLGSKIYAHKLTMESVFRQLKDDSSTTDTFNNKKPPTKSYRAFLGKRLQLAPTFFQELKETKLNNRVLTEAIRFLKDIKRLTEIPEKFHKPIKKMVNLIDKVENSINQESPNDEKIASLLSILKELKNKHSKSDDENYSNLSSGDNNPMDAFICEAAELLLAEILPEDLTNSDLLQKEIPETILCMDNNSEKELQPLSFSNFENNHNIEQEEKELEKIYQELNSLSKQVEKINRLEVTEKEASLKKLALLKNRVDQIKDKEKKQDAMKKWISLMLNYYNKIKENPHKITNNLLQNVTKSKEPQKGRQGIKNNRKNNWRRKRKNKNNEGKIQSQKSNVPVDVKRNSDLNNNLKENITDNSGTRSSEKNPEIPINGNKSEDKLNISESKSDDLQKRLDKLLQLNSGKITEEQLNVPNKLSDTLEQKNKFEEGGQLNLDDLFIRKENLKKAVEISNQLSKLRETPVENESNLKNSGDTRTLNTPISNNSMLNTSLPQNLPLKNSNGLNNQVSPIISNNNNNNNNQQINWNNNNNNPSNNMINNQPLNQPQNNNAPPPINNQQQPLNNVPQPPPPPIIIPPNNNLGPLAKDINELGEELKGQGVWLPVTVDPTDTPQQALEKINRKFQELSDNNVGQAALSEAKRKEWIDKLNAHKQTLDNLPDTVPNKAMAQANVDSLVKDIKNPKNPNAVSFKMTFFAAGSTPSANYVFNPDLKLRLTGVELNDLKISEDQRKNLAAGKTITLYSENNPTKMEIKYNNGLEMTIPSDQKFPANMTAAQKWYEKQRAAVSLIYTMFTNSAKTSAGDPSKQPTIELSGDDPKLVAFAEAVANHINSQLSEDKKRLIKVEKPADEAAQKDAAKDYAAMIKNEEYVSKKVGNTYQNYAISKTKALTPGMKTLDDLIPDVTREEINKSLTKG